MTDAIPQGFQTTHWTQVVAARGNSPAARQALRALCETYYEPVAMFVRRAHERFVSPNFGASSTSTPAFTDESQDLTQEFFAKLLEGHSLDHAEPNRGRFRSYLLGAVKHFLSDRYDQDRALKRGGGNRIQSLTTWNASAEASVSESLQPIARDGFPPDAYFDRLWGLAVIQQAIDTLRAHAESHGELDRFDVLQRWLVTPSSDDSAAAAARSLNLSSGAFKVAVHRLRKRFRQIVVGQISATIDDPADVTDELNYLITAVTFEPERF